MGVYGKLHLSETLYHCNPKSYNSHNQWQSILGAYKIISLSFMRVKHAVENNTLFGKLRFNIGIYRKNTDQLNFSSPLTSLKLTWLFNLSKNRLETICGNLIKFHQIRMDSLCTQIGSVRERVQLPLGLPLTATDPKIFTALFDNLAIFHINWRTTLGVLCWMLKLSVQLLRGRC